MENVTIDDLKKLYLPPKDSHKGKNGKLTIIGGSHLFHGASLWALKVASRIVDMVFYAGIPENNELTQKLKGELYDFICVPRDQVEQYIEESDAVLIGPGMVRSGDPIREIREIISIRDMGNIKEEGELSFYLTKYLLQKFPYKKWIIDAGSLQMMEAEWLNKNCLITPHRGEFYNLFKSKMQNEKSKNTKQKEKNNDDEKNVRWVVKKYGCTVLLKGETDVIGGYEEDKGDEGNKGNREKIKIKTGEGGNSGMTKGGTGDVLAGLVAALACKNDLFLAACAGSFINKKAGEELFQKMGYYFNTSDLCDQIPQTMNNLFLRGAV